MEAQTAFCELHNLGVLLLCVSQEAALSVTLLGGRMRKGCAAMGAVV